MDDTKLSKKLEQVRALLAKAESTTFPAEADALRAKADQLMSTYAIEQWMVDQAEAGRNVREEPVRRDFDRAWRSSKFAGDLRSMFEDLAQHCRCVVGWRGSRGHTCPVYGLPSDLDYLDMLFTSLMVEVAKNLQPPVDPNGELGEQVFHQRQAGITWPEITRKVYLAGLVTLTAGEFAKLRQYAYGNEFDGMDASEIVWSDLHNYPTVQEMVKNRLANYNRRYVREHGLQGQRNYVKPEVYQRSFMWGFTDEIHRRLRAMRRASETTWDRDHKAGSMALAVRDIRSQALSLYEAQYPPPPPVPVDPNAKPSKEIKVREVAVSYEAMSAGARKARDANLANHPSRRVGGNRKELDS